MGANCRFAGLRLPGRKSPHENPACLQGWQFQNPRGSLVAPRPPAFGLSSGKGVGSCFGRAVQSFPWPVILEIFMN